MPVYRRTIIPNDWVRLEEIINELGSRMISQALLTTSSPSFAALTTTGITTATRFVSNIAIGTSPYSCTSTTLNTNLNADLLDSQHGAYYATAADYVPYTGATGDVNLGNFDLSVTCITLPETSSDATGIIFKGTNRFIHNYNDATATGYNTFAGEYSGNFTMSPGGGAAALSSFNVAFGYETLMSNTTGYSNAALGARALRSNTVGIQNVGIGKDALYSNTGGNHNIAICANALRANTTGESNVAIGVYSLYVNTIGYENIGIGNFALTANTEGYRNFALGHDSLYSNTTGHQNVAIGISCLYYNTAASDNTAIGYKAGHGDGVANRRSIVDTQMVFIGAFSGKEYNPDTDPLTNSIAIGYGALATKSNQVVLGNSSITETILRGTVGVNTIHPDRRLDILDSANPQLRLTHTDGTVYVEFQTDASGNLIIVNTGTKIDIGSLDFETTGDITADNLAAGNLDYADKGIWYASTFNNSHPNTLFVWRSFDGKNFELLGSTYTESGLDNLRDPSIRKIGNKYFLVYSYNQGTGDQFGLASSTDLINWTFIQYVDTGGVNYTWAPQWYIDESGDPHIIVSLGADTSHLQPYELHPTNAGLTAWSSPVAITGTDLPANMIDSYIIYSGGTYYLWYKNEVTKYIEYASSSSPFSGYTVTKSGNWAGWGANKYEGITVAKLDSSRFRIYLDYYIGNGYYYADSSDDFATWTVLTAVTFYNSGHDTTMAHGDFIRTNDYDTLKNVINEKNPAFTNIKVTNNIDTLTLGATTVTATNVNATNLTGDGSGITGISLSDISQDISELDLGVTGAKGYLRLKGQGSMGSARGGYIQFDSWSGGPSSPISGYIFANVNKQLVFSNAVQASATDTGLAYINYDGGGAMFANGAVTIGNDGAIETSNAVTAANFVSTIAIGTSPYACTSTTLNTNLNADLWDGYQFSDYLDQAVKTTSAPTFASGTVISGVAITNDGTKTTFLGTSGDYNRIGDAAATSQSLASEDDLLITGKLEVDGTAYFDGQANFYNECTMRSDYRVIDNATMYFGSGYDFGLIYGTAQTPDSMLMCVSNDSKALVLTNIANRTADHSHALQANPTLFIHSDTAMATSKVQWISITHDQTNGVIDVGTGAVSFPSSVILGDASTDTITHTGRMIVRTVNDAGMAATNGSTAEIVFNTNDTKFYGCTAGGTPATWAALN